MATDLDCDSVNGSEAEIDLLESLNSLEEEVDHHQKLLEAHTTAERHNKCAMTIQTAWHKYRQNQRYSMTKDINVMHSVRANPFDVQFAVEQSNSETASSEASPSHDHRAARQSILIEDDLMAAPSPSEEPIFHMAALEAQLYAIGAREQHIDTVFTTRQVNDYPSEDEDELLGSNDFNRDIKRIGVGYQSMQICFVGEKEDKCEDQATGDGLVSGRESRGAADGASTGEPAPQEELDEELERSATPVGDNTSEKSIDSLKRDFVTRTIGSATPTQEMEWLNDADVEDDSCMSPQFGLRMWRRSEQRLTASQLHCLTVEQLVVLRNEVQHIVRMTSDELVNLLTLRDSLACQRDEFNVYFEAYSQQMEKRYRRAAIKGNSSPVRQRKRIPWLSGNS